MVTIVNEVGEIGLNGKLLGELLSEGKVVLVFLKFVYQVQSILQLNKPLNLHQLLHMCLCNPLRQILPLLQTHNDPILHILLPNQLLLLLIILHRSLPSTQFT